MRVDAQHAELALYSYGRLVPRSYPIVSSYTINVTGMRDPQSSGGFRKRYTDGRPGEVQAYMKDDPRYKAIADNVAMLAHMHLRSDGRNVSSPWVSFAFMDFHGKWAGPAITEAVAEELSASGYKVQVFHYDLIKMEAIK